MVGQIAARTPWSPVEALSPPTIYSFAFDDVTNELSHIGNFSGATGPTIWLAFSHDKKTLFSTNGGGWASYDITRDAITKHPILSPPTTIPSTGPCQNSTTTNQIITSSNGFIYGIHYGGGPKGADTTSRSNCGEVLGPIRGSKGNFQSIQAFEYGLPFNSSAHGLALSPNEKWLYSVDMRSDALYTHSVDRKTGKVALASRVDTELGAHPRHVAVHSSGKRVYIVNEAANTLSVWSSEGKNASKPVWEEEWDLLSGFGHEVKNRTQFWSSEVQVDPKGEFVFASTRVYEGDIPGYYSVYKVNKKDGKIESLLTRQETKLKGQEVAHQFKVAKWRKGHYIYLANPRIAGMGGLEILRWDSRNNKLESVADFTLGDKGCCSAADWLD
ncbi:3-carboxy-cis,cis-mucoante lactonizing enzyme [Ascobolus immersus RN42]|uniref:3-carboxy-cis,cis-mucoante lactonizing enzyme n=1 Tax=Ascobolus immersus RN42 TaxID=1160509 RepID=A0A3N4HKQ5_ASCIM|nr:3-carboxy-cis,cis-mucoante lactonizing enzyme [Ascobolus immersus RN42]